MPCPLTPGQRTDDATGLSYRRQRRFVIYDYCCLVVKFSRGRNRLPCFAIFFNDHLENELPAERRLEEEAARAEKENKDRVQQQVNDFMRD